MPRGLQDCVRAFEEQFDFVHRTLRRLGVPSADVEDLAQEVFVVMWRRWGEFDQRRALRAWLNGIAFNVVGSHRRRVGREVPFDQLEPPDPRAGGEEALAETRARRLVLGALAHIPDAYRTVLVLRDIDGVPMRQIAAMQGVPLFTAYTRLRRARRDFAEAIRQQSERADRRRAALLGPGLLVRPLLRLAFTALVAAGLLWLSLPPGSVHGEATRSRAAMATRPALALRSPRAFAQTPPPAAVMDEGPAKRSADSTPAAAPPAHWQFDEAAGATARDRFGQSPDCLLRGIAPERAWTRGRRGSAVQLGRQGWLECPRATAADGGAGELTVAAWVRVDKLPPTGNVAVVTRQLGSGAADQFFLGFVRGRLVVSSNSWGVALHAAVTLLPDRWHHLAFTRSAAGVTLYLDGRPVRRRRLGNLRADPVDTPILIGGGSNQAAVVRELLDGAVDDVMIHPRALDDEEIAALAVSLQD